MGYKMDDEITLTFGGLKNAQNEAFKDGILFAASQIQYFLPDEITKTKVVALLHALSNTELYSVDDEDEECSCDHDCGADSCEGEE